MTYKQTIAGICRVHGYYSGNGCRKCEAEYAKGIKNRQRMNIYFNSHDWVKKGTYEHIDASNPNMRFNSKEELKKACEERGLLAKAFMKPKSRGKGWEHSKR